MTSYIALDSELGATLQATLEATRLELEKIQAQQRGQDPLTMKQAAAYLHVSAPTLAEYIRRGEITPSEYGSRVWIVQAELDEFIKRHRRKQSSAK